MKQPLAVGAIAWYILALSITAMFLVDLTNSYSSSDYLSAGFNAIAVLSTLAVIFSRLKEN